MKDLISQTSQKYVNQSTKLQKSSALPQLRALLDEVALWKVDLLLDVEADQLLLHGVLRVGMVDPVEQRLGLLHGTSYHRQETGHHKILTIREMAK